jgi:hypothetical protein
MEGFMPGREVVILGSGDIGLIMARRMTLEGARVKVVAELMPYSGGLKRNIVQCLDDYGIPLKLSHTVVDIQGKERVTGITLAEVGLDRKPIPGTEEHYSCDTLLLSVGLIPENELTKEAGVEMNRVTSGPNVNDQLETSVEGVFACGNVLHVHDLVDYVSEEATLAGINAAAYVRSQNGETEAKAESHTVTLKAENGVRYTVPQTIDVNNMRDQVVVRFRVADVYRDRSISVYLDGVRVQARKKKVLAPGEMEQVILKKEDLQKILDDLAYGDKYGEVLRAKGMVPSEEKGVWLHFDMVPEQAEIREGAPDFTGKVCVIGAELDEEGLKAAFNA